MAKLSALLLALLPLAASATLRGLQAATTPMVERVCNATELDTLLDTLTAKDECAKDWPTFSERIGTDDFLQLSLDDQTKELDDFCNTACGPVFNAAVSDWRTWCDSNRASFEAIADDGKDFSFDGFVAEFGCTKNAAGGYCARVVMDELSAAPDNTKAKCDYFTSCCFGEMHRLVKLTDLEARAAKVETKCPGARAALDLRCSA